MTALFTKLAIRSRSNWEKFYFYGPRKNVGTQPVILFDLIRPCLRETISLCAASDATSRFYICNSIDILYYISSVYGSRLFVYLLPIEFRIQQQTTKSVYSNVLVNWKAKMCVHHSRGPCDTTQVLYYFMLW